MEKDLNKKFVCKYCCKSYPCGKSLGGHLRSHRMVSSAVDDCDDENVKLSEVFGRSNNKIEFKSLAEVDEVSHSQTAYVLREKPKRSWRFSNSGNGKLEEQLKICKECGKGFQSVKALCGHMACHSEKDKKRLVVEEDESDSELSGLRLPRTSKRVRYPSLVNDDGCSSGSESELEQEEVALCLMILSRDTRKWFGVNSAGLSDNNLNKSSSAEMEVIGNGGLTRISSFGEYEGHKNLKGKEFGNAKFEILYDSDDKNFGGEMNNVEPDNSGELFFRDIGLKKRKVRHRFEAPNGYGDLESGWGKNLAEEEEYKQQDRAFKKYKPRTGTMDKSISPDVLKNIHKFENGSSSDNVKVYQNVGCESMGWSNENSRDTDPCYAQTSVSRPLGSSSSKLPIKKKLPNNAGKRAGPRKKKGHQCPFCFKVFRSGQALGGHKRIHLIGGSEDTAFVIEQEMRNQLDLNLPATIEEEVDGHP